MRSQTVNINADVYWYYILITLHVLYNFLAQRWPPIVPESAMHKELKLC